MAKHDSTKYVLEKTCGGWICRVDGKLGTGWGSRPDLAIRNWKEQNRKLNK